MEENGPGRSHWQVALKKKNTWKRLEEHEDFGRAFQTEEIAYGKALNMPGIYTRTNTKI